MSLLKMSFTGAVMILVIVVIRALTINKLPKKTFLALWGIVLLRLLLPFSLPSMFSAYSVIEQNTSTMQVIQNTPAENFFPTALNRGMTTIPSTAGVVGNETSIWAIVWGVGVFVCFLYFAVSYIKCYREFQTSLPVENDFVKKWLGEHRIKRQITIRQSSRISTPLTYGVFRPVILMPKSTEWNNTKSLQYVLAHEYVHIRRLDALTKLILTAGLCVHWFNPLVWVMYILANRDIELSCDESVVRFFGEENKSTYARTLISMEENRSDLPPLYNSFSKNAIEERVTAIMKIKKTSLIAICVAVALVTGITIVFATSATGKDGFLSANEEEKTQQLAFGKVLWDVYQRGILPDGSLLEYGGMEFAANNNFSIVDVDGDGKEELVLFWENASMAGTVAYVFGYNDGMVHVELTEFPILTFYDNGIVEAAWSHNQNLAGRFWPYKAYRYDAKTDVYQSLGGVDAWDKNVREENEKGDHFPTYIDADGDGLVYYILPANWNGQYDMSLVDGADYESWRNAYMEGAKEITISRQMLTEENIAALGYPKPDIPLPPQPQG
ncbi:M56 family metallopeptidase [Anaerosporobacter sp.]|uniref:M56 family metallopeptidase n=1 Tax=Anaerosporobacter sp. TaxID=1872529 RepID=UPI00286F4A37|nr:M56 family metallopeptidase [Anaerosporobacter sp.]